MTYLAPVIFVFVLWWASTTVLLYRVALPRSASASTLAGSIALALLGFVAVLWSLENRTGAGAYAAFAGALAIWAAHETSYLLGYVDGPRPEACPPQARGWQRLWLGVQACLYHELAIVLTAGLLAVVSLGAENRVGLWTFVILWLMRWSAKLNIFLGVRNLHLEFWPEHLDYLQSFVRERSMNALFPVSIIVSTTIVGVLGITAAGAGDDAAARTGAMLLATLLSLAAIEHGLLMARVPDEWLWRLGMRSRSPEAPGGSL